LFKCIERFSEVWGNVKPLLLEFPTTCVAEQGCRQVLHTRNKYGNDLHMNKTGGNTIRLKLTNLHTALKKLTDEKPGARFLVDGTHRFSEINYLFSINARAFVLFVRCFVLCSLFCAN